MDYAIPAFPFAACLLAGMIICLDIGRRIGRRWIADTVDGAKPSFGSVETAVFSLYGLLLAFTFSGAPARLDTRRQLIAEEANVVNTAYLRLDLLGPDERPAVQQHFREYIDSRLAAYRLMPDLRAAEAELARSTLLQKDLWTEAIAATARPGSSSDALKMIMPAMNALIDIARTRAAAERIHPPLIIFALLFVLALVCSMLAGFGMAGNRRRSWLHIASYAVITVITIFSVLEIEYPRLGLLPVESSYDRILQEVRDGMN